MSIRAYLNDSDAFDAVEIKGMSIALEDVCKALKLPIEALEPMQIITERIIQLAREGERDPRKLSEMMLREAVPGPMRQGVGRVIDRLPHGAHVDRAAKGRRADKMISFFRKMIAANRNRPVP